MRRLSRGVGTSGGEFVVGARDVAVAEVVVLGCEVVVAVSEIWFIGH